MRKEKKKMKLITKKIKEYIKKSKRAKLYGIRAPVEHMRSNISKRFGVSC